MIGISNVILNDIGEDVGTDSNTVMNLGISLKFSIADINTYVTSNLQSGNVSPTGTKKMLFDWKRNTSCREQKDKLRKALIKAKLLGIAEEHLSENVGTDSKTVMKAPTQPKLLQIADKHLSEKDQKLRCLKCDRIIAKITDVISKQSEDAVSSKVRYILGKKCLVQLMKTNNSETKAQDGRCDVITMTTADVTLDEEVCLTSAFEGYQKHRGTWCKGCPDYTHQIGWYVESSDDKLAFYAISLQKVIHDTYDSDNTVNAFLVENRNED